MITNDLFSKKWKELTKDEWPYIRLSTVKVLVKSMTAEYTIIYPKMFEQRVQEKKGAIEGHLKTLLDGVFSPVFYFKPMHFDVKIFRAELFEILKKYPAINSVINDNSITIARRTTSAMSTSNTDNVDKSYAIECIEIKIEISQAVYDYCVSSGFIDKVKTELYYLYVIDFDIVLVALNDIADSGEYSRQSSVVLQYPDSGRVILVDNIERIFGKPIGNQAQYIEDANSPKNDIVLCGNLLQWESMTAKESGKVYYRFGISDFTGEIRGVYFPLSSTKLIAETITTGQQVIISGKLEIDKYKQGNMSLMLNAIAKCSLPTDFKYNKKQRLIADCYITVSPKPYVGISSTTQDKDLFSVDNATTTKQDSVVVVFDIETTGLNATECSIIDIGAVKIVNGIIKETFESLIDPLVDIPSNITTLTGITTDMVKGQPSVDKVLIDFARFVEGTTIAAHNIEFDFSFIKYHGKKSDIYFNNPQIDTLSMARKKYPTLKHHKLATLCKEFGIVNNTAHRALSDATATAQLYLMMVN